MADQVAVLREGRLVQRTDPRTLYRRPGDLDVALFVGEAVVLDAEIRDGTAHCALGALSYEQTSDEPGGRRRRPRPAPPRAAPALRPGADGAGRAGAQRRLLRPRLPRLARTARRADGSAPGWRARPALGRRRRLRDGAGERPGLPDGGGAPRCPCRSPDRGASLLLHVWARCQNGTASHHQTRIAARPPAVSQPSVSENRTSIRAAGPRRSRPPAPPGRRWRAVLAAAAPPCPVAEQHQVLRRRRDQQGGSPVQPRRAPRSRRRAGSR